MGLKARVKATGDIFDIEGVSLRLTGKVLSTFGLDEVEVLVPDSTPIYWTRLEHQYAGMFMQVMITDPALINVYSEDGKIAMKSFVETATDICYDLAHALVEKYKKEE